MIRACRRLDARGLVAGTEGNASARLGAQIIITPAGVRKGALRARDLVVVTANGGRVRVPPRARGAHMPSSELALHLAIYAARPDVGAVVHAHPPAATAFAVAGRELSPALAELVGVVGRVPLVPYRRPGTAALGEVVARAMGTANAALMANHGVVTVGSDVTEALNLMESVEQAARILAGAHILGGATSLPESDLQDIDRARLRAATPRRRPRDLTDDR